MIHKWSRGGMTLANMYHYLFKSIDADGGVPGTTLSSADEEIIIEGDRANDCPTH